MAGAHAVPGPGSSFGHYLLRERIGAGGMGEVYLAADTHLEREVAIKFLPRDSLRDEAARRRFRKEALALSKLNHPNIETVYDFDREGERDYLALEYVAGETLADIRKPLDDKSILELGAQLADGLAAAHDRGIVHRDIKPANLRLTPQGLLKILDFGLASLPRETTPASATAMTESVVFAGTLPYMAPEQLLGTHVDARSDVWAAGAVLYEMATGRGPYSGSGPQLVENILHGTPVPPSRLNQRVSASLSAVIMKCLDPDPAARYQSARELAIDLRRVQSGSQPMVASIRPGRDWRRPALLLASTLLVVVVTVFFANRWRTASADPHISSMAVLPVVNLSGDIGQEYFSDGMTDAIISELSKIRPLRVAPRSSVMRYKNSNKSPSEIAKELNVNALLEASVIRDGSRVRVNTSLIDGRDESRIWVETYDRNVGDILAVHGEIASAIAALVRIELTAEQQQRLSRGTIDPEAYELLLRAGYHAHLLTPEHVAKAEQYAREALIRKPDYADAYALLAATAFFRGQTFGLTTTEETRHILQEGREAALRAIALDSSLGLPHSFLGLFTAGLDLDFAGAEREYLRGIELEPTNGSAISNYGTFLAMMGRCDEARVNLLRALELQPDAFHEMLAGHYFLHCGWFAEGEAHLRQAIALEPNFAYPHRSLAFLYQFRGDIENSIAELRESGMPARQADAALASYRQGGKRAFHEWRIRQLKESPRGARPRSMPIAMQYALLGDRLQTVTYLKKAFEERDPSFLFARSQPPLHFLYGDPEYETLLRRAGFPPLRSSPRKPSP